MRIFSTGSAYLDIFFGFVIINFMYTYLSTTLMVFSIIFLVSYSFATDKLTPLNGLEIGVGYQINFIKSNYNKYTSSDDAQQAFDISYEHVNLAYFKILWRDVFRYEKVYPIGKTSKRVFGLWRKKITMKGICLV